MRLRSKLVLLLSVTLAAGLLAACGDDEPAPTKEEFIAEADAICAEGDQRVDEQARERFGDSRREPPKEEQIAFIQEVVAPEIAQQREQIGELRTPEGDEERIDELLTALDELVRQLDEDTAALLEQNELPEASRLAQEYGFESCGS